MMMIRFPSHVSLFLLLVALGGRGGPQGGAKDVIPKGTGDTEAVVVVGEMVFEVQFLDVAVVQGEAVLFLARGPFFFFCKEKPGKGLVTHLRWWRK